ncbi:hypothetical protein QJS10_CPA16g00610 [Acorus calamus]|uniref:Uncharacterized protein n=1 Tax=Acorus calamus TaxID=4465 RepID=A0AAV9D350_ACOCL|nr:hypothetical protein QJS10_CPA16g00610 [Acorus calamus]
MVSGVLNRVQGDQMMKVGMKWIMWRGRKLSFNLISGHSAKMTNDESDQMMKVGMKWIMWRGRKLSFNLISGHSAKIFKDPMNDPKNA